MAHVSPQIEYLSTGANRHCAVADWSVDGILAYGADANVALWRPESNNPRGVETVLAGHTGVVKAVTFLPQEVGIGEEVSYLVTGADDFKLKLWSISKDLTRCECIQTVDAHSASVTCLAALKSWSKPSDVLLASGAADYSIKVWKFDSGQLHPVQTIKTAQGPRFFPLTLALCTLGGDDSSFVLAAGGTRRTIHIYGASRQGGEIDFKPQATLSGHEDWIRALDFTLETTDIGTSDLLLASASQDKYIRLWRVHEGVQVPVLSSTATADPLRDAYLASKGPSNKAHRIKVADRDFTITFEALLLGHEDWIYAVQWNRGSDDILRLLSASADNSLVIWEVEPESGIWASTTRLGEISRDKGATTATGSIGGFWTGLWRADGRSMVCLGRTGSWRRWDFDESDQRWKPAIAVTGHTKPVTGIAWSRDGAYLLSSSSDQTTRLHASWTELGGAGTWHEMSRPQIHGYDLNCIDSLGVDRFVSGADEKLLRVFREPRPVAQLLNRLCRFESDAEAMPEAANIPSLGLSNKAVDPDAPEDVGGGGTVDTATDALKSALEIDRPPFEDALSKYTLWPEIEKLYGHGYEISCLAASNDGRLVASACKASASTHAVVRLFETERWTEVKPPLVAHSLTATRLRFSADDRYLLSVGRDRQWAVFERGDGDAFSLLQSDPKGHSRMILDAAWAPEGWVFVTAGRDKQVKVWRATEGEGKLEFALAGAIPSGQPVTAIDFLPRNSRAGHLVLAMGNEAGSVSICELSTADLSLVSRSDLESRFCPSKSVLQLSWRPSRGEQGDGATLAIAGEDTCLRIYRFGEI
ncbi:related to ELP2 - 29 kDa subunit of elongator and elongating RNA polymerase II holoenzyme [Cephalotrichum gorgonifer]|uniref:Elongator complex protein 2 n=1 Tax=Cephalotrichum gorgonifer TaxID=2041049 RepID=A0AAE8MW32_9PEZI|nr:related to ELP2 - 29 kDa subunit of elongator and elongating RNA polymerase II holoenzyme [Cephalotrichum gorgonifer]